MYLVTTGRSFCLVGFMVCVLLLVIYKHRVELHTTEQRANSPPAGFGPQTRTPEEVPQYRR